MSHLACEGACTAHPAVLRADLVPGVDVADHVRQLDVGGGHHDLYVPRDLCPIELLHELADAVHGPVGLPVAAYKELS